jgi:hypothetical protein
LRIITLPGGKKCKPPKSLHWASEHNFVKQLILFVLKKQAAFCPAEWKIIAKGIS